MAAWPSQLQQLLNVDAFNFQYGNTLIRTDMDVGPAKIRSRSTVAVDNYNASIDMSSEQKQYLDTFYRTTINNGALAFDMADPFTGVTGSFRFLEPPNIVPLGKGGLYFRVALKLEKMP